MVMGEELVHHGEMRNTQMRFDVSVVSLRDLRWKTNEKV